MPKQNLSLRVILWSGFAWAAQLTPGNRGQGRAGDIEKRLAGRGA